MWQYLNQLRARTDLTLHQTLLSVELNTVGTWANKYAEAGANKKWHGQTDGQTMEK